jgi:uncharacterized protein with GYD domain
MAPAEGALSNMTHLSASKLTFAPKWDDMSDDERTAEQVAAVEIVTKCGGSIKAQHLLMTDGCLLSITEYPDETAALKSALAIARRGAFVLQTQTAIPLDVAMSWQDEIQKVAGK